MTFCVIIKSELSTNHCPLPKNACVWKHAILGTCTYNKKFASSDPTPAEIALRTGNRAPSPEEVLAIRNKLIKHLKENL